MSALIPTGAMRYGMQLPVVAKSPIFAADWEQTAGRDEMARIARAADAAAFFYLGVCDHVAVPRSRAAQISTVWFDTVATLGWLSGITSRTRILSNVYVIAYRNPLLTASAFTSLDELSGGRVIMGVGAGHLREEFEALGIAYDSRGALTDEAIDVVRAAWREEFPSIRTPHWHFDDMGVAPRPRQRELTIWIGGSSRRALRRVAERGDGWLPEGTPIDQLPPAIDYIRKERDRLRPGEPFDVGAGVAVYVGKAAWDVGEGTLTGDPDHIAARIRAFGDIEVNHVQLRFPSRGVEEQIDQIEAFGRDVAGLLPGAPGS